MLPSGRDEKRKIVMGVSSLALLAFAGLPRGPVAADPVDAVFKLIRRPTRERKLPEEIPKDVEEVRQGFRWKGKGDWAWLLARIVVPEKVGGVATKDRPLGAIVSCAADGEVYLRGRFRVRYDDSRPACVLVSESAQPGESLSLAVHAHSYSGEEDESVLSEVSWVLLDPVRVWKAVEFQVDPSEAGAGVPDGLVGLSQGGAMALLDDATAQRLRQGRFRWFRLGEALAGCAKRQEGKLAYDFTELEKRLKFIDRVGAEAILTVSYVPRALDSNGAPPERGVPLDYEEWEDMCYRAAKHCVERKIRVPCWEVWSEPNARGIQPGTQDVGSERFESLYSHALGKPATDRSAVRAFEAYVRHYAAAARGIRRADPIAAIGGPALAGGPFEMEEETGCLHGRAFTRGLLLWCQEEELPLDFLSWHGYAERPAVFRRQAEAFRSYLEEFPELKRSVKSLTLTEWNLAPGVASSHDNEIGAAWCANTVLRAFIPAQVDRPCLFRASQGDTELRGDPGILLADSTPKPQYHVARMFNTLTGRWIDVQSGDPEVASTAVWDEKVGRLAVVLVNYADRHNIPRRVRLHIKNPARAKSLEYRVDGTRSNVWHDPARSELEVVREADWPAGDVNYEGLLPPHSVSLIEFLLEQQ